MVLENYVRLVNNVPTRLHFRDHSIDKRTITDPETGKPGFRNVLTFQVDRVDGKEALTTFSTMADKLASNFQPYLADKSYRNFEILITQSGEGYMRRWSVQFIPLAKV